MKTVLFALFTLLAAPVAPAFAQHHQHAGSAHSSAYAGMQNREIKALSDEQIQGLRSGKGMAMAMPAELNGFPGPAHVVELASQLKLSDAQISRTRQLFSEMETQAKAAGEALIAAEGRLDALFRSKQVSDENLSSAVNQAALAQGKLRETHLRYHLRMMDVLSAEQVASYTQLRGY